MAISSYSSDNIFAELEFVLKYASLLNRALLWNIPGVTSTLLLAVASGLVLYAVYGHCDPRITGDIEKADQLMPFIIQVRVLGIPEHNTKFLISVFCGDIVLK